MKDVLNMPSHTVIQEHINKLGEDYRYEDKPSSIKGLQNRKEDNITLGRK